MNYSFDYDNTLIKYKYIRDSNGEIIDVVYDLPHYENKLKIESQVLE